METNPVKPVKDRFLTWSYCGDLEDGFKSSIAFFKNWLPTHVCRSDVSDEERIDIYNNSVFVLVFDSLNTDEIIRAGAIPVFMESGTDAEKVKECMLKLKHLNSAASTNQS